MLKIFFLSTTLVILGSLSFLVQKFYKFGIGWNSTQEDQFYWMISNPGPIASLTLMGIGGVLFYFSKDKV